MFFHIVLERNMQLHPRHFGPKLPDKLVAKLMKDVEGTCSGRHGFVGAIMGLIMLEGLIRDGTGFVTFPVKYQCVVFRPFKGEILEAVVTMVNKMIPDDMKFQSGDIPNYTTFQMAQDSEVRLNIFGTRDDFCTGAIKDDFLDVINDQELLLNPTIGENDNGHCFYFLISHVSYDDESFPAHLLNWSLFARKRG
ncbi:hypothetical protein MKX03_020015 [Papaver bracteatum]|nr:hypothetical protein MKX03_020015 [Papaver bracteatum]